MKPHAPRSHNAARSDRLIHVLTGNHERTDSETQALLSLMRIYCPA